MHTSIAGYGEFAGARCDKNQDSIAIAGLFHAHLHKMGLGSGYGVLDGLAADKNPDFARGFLFGCANRRDDVLVLKLLKKFSRLHKSPTATRATTSETAAATREPVSTGKTAAAATPVGKPSAAEDPTAQKGGAATSEDR